MAERTRVQRWREAQRASGLQAMTLWLTTEAELPLKDLATPWHGSPSALVPQALARFQPANLQRIRTATEIALIRTLIREELGAMRSLGAPVTAGDPATGTETQEVTALGNSRVPATAAPTAPATRPRRGRQQTDRRQRLAAVLEAHPDGVHAEQ
jgi:hypothetical protein